MKVSVNRWLCVPLVLVLCACAQRPIPIAYECPKLQLPADPVAPVRTLTPQSSADEVIKAWVATAVAYETWNVVVRKQVNSSL